MSVWWYLFRKEFRLMRTFWIVNGLLLLCAGLISGYAVHLHRSVLPELFLAVFLAWHTFYLLLYLLLSFHEEQRNAPLWMQSPQSGWLLLSAKFVAGWVLFCLSWILTLLLLWVVTEGVPGWRSLNGGILILAFTQRVLFFAELGALVYFLFHVFGNRLKGWRWALYPVFFVGMVFLTVQFKNTSLYDIWFRWGAVDAVSPPPPADATGPSAAHVFHNLFGAPIYGGDLLFGLVLTGVWFYLAGWLLDRKVEV
ncbi:hypothetical protein [Paludifilum halophilum]|uniref:Uncharacterized protein n=1 Tax=Paludifilum halophilum TaxID=1642702 RepID=A0A235B8V1_9BACL|nr:hypothetical protein [Paludifilum halophilum]OYD08307.1 hypothetical protein CHM34_05520 [Paludifilum halophilum]